MVAKTVVVAAMVCLLLGAGEPAPTDGAKAEMKKVDWLVGRWSGEGWIRTGPERREFAGTETVRRKVGGLAVLIEGNFREKGAAADAPAVHNTLGVLWYDPAKQHYWLNAWLHTGRNGQYEARAVSENEVQWFIPLPQGQGQIRYTMKLDAQKRWAETGEMSPDGGKTWHRFFEMTLTKVEDEG